MNAAQEALADAAEWDAFTRWSGDADAGRIGESTLRLAGLRCAACGPLIESTLKSLPGVLDVRASTATSRLVLRWDPRRTQPTDWLRALHAHGYDAVPDLAGIEALRLPQAEGVAASAAPWIHLYALQLLLLVLLPRAVLALWAARRAAVLRCDLPLPLAEPYFVRLLRQAQGGQQHLRLWPHARTPDAQAIARLKALLQRIYGDGVSLQVEPTVAYGSEDTPVPPAADGALRLVLCDLGATPEPESQGRLLQALGRPLLLVDEAAFVQRFGAGSPRRDERRQAWSALAASLGCAVVFIDLQAADLAASEADRKSVV